MGSGAGEAAHLVCGLHPAGLALAPCEPVGLLHRGGHSWLSPSSEGLFEGSGEAVRGCFEEQGLSQDCQTGSLSCSDSRLQVAGIKPLVPVAGGTWEWGGRGGFRMGPWALLGTARRGLSGPWLSSCPWGRRGVS